MQTKPGLAKTVFTLAGAIMGDAGINSLADVLKNKEIKKMVNTAEAKTLQKKLKDIGGTEDFINKTAEEQRQTIVKDIESELYKPQGLIETLKTIKEKSTKDIQTAEIMFKRAVEHEDKNTIENIINNYSNGVKKDINEIFTQYKNIQEPENIQKIESLLAKAKGGTQERDLMDIITDETVLPFKEKIKQKVEEASQKYESNIKDLPEEKINATEIKANIMQKTKSNVLSEDQKQIENYYLKKIDESKNIGDIINLNKEINQDLYSAPNDGVKYSLSQIKEGIKQYIKKESKEKEQFQKLLQANEEYTKDKTNIDELRQILDKLHGGKDRYYKAENRELEKGSIAFKRYKSLSPEEQKILLENLPKNQAETFKKINLQKMNSKDFGKYSDIELQNAFDENLYKEAQGLSVSSSKGLSNSGVMQQMVKDFKNEKITSDDLQTMAQVFKETLTPEGATKLDEFINRVQKEQSVFKQAEFMPYLRAGDTSKAAQYIKTADDLKMLYTMKERLQTVSDKEAVNSFFDTILQKKQKEFAENLSQKIENDDMMKNIDNLEKFLSKNKNYYQNLYNNNDNFTKNLNDLLEKYIPSQRKSFEEAYKKAEELANNNQIFQKYIKTKNKLEKIKNEKAFGIKENIPAFLTHTFTHNWWLTLMTKAVTFGYKQLQKALLQKKMKNFVEDPKYIEKLLKQQNVFAESIQNFIEHLAPNVKKTLKESTIRDIIVEEN